MKILMATVLAVGLVTVFARPARAEAPGARDVQAAVDSYLSTSPSTSPSTALGDASLVGGPGSAGYDAGFWIRGGDFLLRVNLTLQARFESFDWSGLEPATGGDLSGYSLPRASVKFSGEAPCRICYYLALEFGHQGDPRHAVISLDREGFFDRTPTPSENPGNVGPHDPSRNFDNSREAWIEWCHGPAFNVRMGQIGIPSARQLMTPPELQQFVDVSLASAWVGQGLPGYTDRPRDFGTMVHGSFGCRNEWSYMLTVTNGDGGDSIRNVLDNRTDDNLAYGARLNWAFLQPIGYEEGALRQMTCSWYGEVGAWVFYFADRLDKPHTTKGDVLSGGADLALGYGGWSFTAACCFEDIPDWPGSGGADGNSTSWLAQVGFLFPDTAWEVAARVDSYTFENGDQPQGRVTEFAFAVNYYLNGHGNKLSLDASFLEASDDAIGITDMYTGYNSVYFNDKKAIFVRFQWQLAL